MTSIYVGCIIIITDIYKCRCGGKIGRIQGKEELPMAEERQPLFVGVDTVIFDLGVSRAKAYDVIKQLNKELKKENPRAIVVAGKVNRIWYEEACLKAGIH